MNRKVFKARRTAKSYVFSQIRLIQTTMESFEYTGLIFTHSHFTLWYNVMIVDIKIYNKVIYNLHVLDRLFLSPLSNCLLKVMIIVSPLFIIIPWCHLLPCGPWNLTMNSLSPPRIVTSCLLSILIQVKDAKIHWFFYK